MRIYNISFRLFMCVFVFTGKRVFFLHWCVCLLDCFYACVGMHCAYSPIATVTKINIYCLTYALTKYTYSHSKPKNIHKYKFKLRTKCLAAVVHNQCNDVILTYENCLHGNWVKSKIVMKSAGYACRTGILFVKCMPKRERKHEKIVKFVLICVSCYFIYG